MNRSNLLNVNLIYLPSEWFFLIIQILFVFRLTFLSILLKFSFYFLCSFDFFNSIQFSKRVTRIWIEFYWDLSCSLVFSSFFFKYPTKFDLISFSPDISFFLKWFNFNWFYQFFSRFFWVSFIFILFDLIWLKLTFH